MRFVSAWRSIAVSHLDLRLLLLLGEIDEPAEPVRAALAAAGPSDAFGELQRGRHVPFREI